MDNYPYSKYIFEPRLLSDENPILGDIIFRNNQGDYTTVVNIFNKESCSRLNIDAFPLEELKNDIDTKLELIHQIESQNRNVLKEYHKTKEKLEEFWTDRPLV